MTEDLHVKERVLKLVNLKEEDLNTSFLFKNFTTDDLCDKMELIEKALEEDLVKSNEELVTELKNVESIIREPLDIKRDPSAPAPVADAPSPKTARKTNEASLEALRMLGIEGKRFTLSKFKVSEVYEMINKID